MVEEVEDKELRQLQAYFKYNISTDEILSGRLKVLMADLSWQMDMPTWTKEEYPFAMKDQQMDMPTWTREELDVMCARMDALVEVSNLLYDIQWHRLNWERKQNG